MNSTEADDRVFGLASEGEEMLALSHQEFKVALERSAEILRQAIVAAQQSISSQLNREALDRLQSNIARAPEIPLKQLTVDVVDEAFKQAKEMLDDLERASAAFQPGEYTPQTAVPAPENVAEELPADPLAATESFMMQATDSLNDAMNAIIRATEKQPAEAESGGNILDVRE